MKHCELLISQYVQVIQHKNAAILLDIWNNKHKKQWVSVKKSPLYTGANAKHQSDEKDRRYLDPTTLFHAKSSNVILQWLKIFNVVLVLQRKATY